MEFTVPDTFKDYADEEIVMSDETWDEHISQKHPEITKEQIRDVLANPDKVCISQRKEKLNHRQYHQGPWKNPEGKDRFWKVVVKVCDDGNWISTAMTTSRINCGEVLFPIEKEEGEK